MNGMAMVMAAQSCWKATSNVSVATTAAAMRNFKAGYKTGYIKKTKTIKPRRDAIYEAYFLFNV